jgi:hypothetical protein
VLFFCSVPDTTKDKQHNRIVISIDGRCGVVVGLLAFYARGRGYDSRTVQTFMCMNMSVCIGSGCFNVYVCIYKKNVYKYLLIRYLESITQAFQVLTFGLVSRECKCLEYLLFI